MNQGHHLVEDNLRSSGSQNYGKMDSFSEVTSPHTPVSSIYKTEIQKKNSQLYVFKESQKSSDLIVGGNKNSKLTPDLVQSDHIVLP